MADKNNKEEDPLPDHYIAKDHIMNSGNEKTNVDVENLSRSTSSAPPDKSIKKETTKLEVPGDMDGDKIDNDITEDGK